MSYPCPACGLMAFDELPGSYDLCPVCNWEDDGVQLRYPAMRGGANADSLFEYQQKVLKYLPARIEETKGHSRDPSWRPLTPDECTDLTDMPQTGREYFDSIDAEELSYYWRR